tara:strand:+ start:550 stop:1269 length:720 start_codon:yes stop_codon:yes gene_type:complete
VGFLINPFSVATPASWEFEDDFTSYGTQGAANAVWVPVVTGTVTNAVDISNDYLKLVSPSSTSFYYGSNTRALTATDDAAFVLRYKLHWISANQAGGYSADYCTGLFNVNSSTASNAAQDYIGVVSQVQAGVQKFVTAAGNNASPVDGGNFKSTFTSWTPTNGQDNWIETIRTSSTSFTVESFSDDTYETSVESKSDSCDSTITDLDFTGIKGGTGNANAAQSYYIDDVQFANGVTVAP